MSISRFFFFLAGSSEAVIRDCPEAERNYHAAIGAFVLITATAASLSGGYALYTIFRSVPMAILFGIFWGFTIGAIDRFIVMTMDLTAYGSRFRTLFAAVSRLVIAVFVAFVIARPLELRIFAPEIGDYLQGGLAQSTELTVAKINAELEQRKLAYEGNQRLSDARSRTAALESDQARCLAEEAVLRDAVHGECDGTLGTMRVGVGPICKLKRNDLEDVSARCAEIRGLSLEAASLVAKIEEENDRVFGEMRAASEQQITAVRAESAAQFDAIEQGDAGSLLTRIEALHTISQQSSGLWWSLWFITLLFVLVEAMPVGLKLMVAGHGNYANRLHLDEKESGKRHRIERKYRERERTKHRQAIYEIADAVRDQQRTKAIDNLSRGIELVTDDVNHEIRFRTEVASKDLPEARTAFPIESYDYEDPTDEQTALAPNPPSPVLDISPPARAEEHLPRRLR